MNEINDYIKEHYLTETDLEIGGKFGLSEKAARSRRCRMGLKKSQQTFRKEASMKPQSVKREVLEERKALAFKGENALLKAKVRQLMKEANAQDRIIEYNKLSIDALRPVKTVPFVFSKEKVKESAVLIGSCFHIGERINLEQMGGLNEYNFDIFIRRFQRLVDTTITFTTGNMSNHKFEELHIFLTGDMVSGDIHQKQEGTNVLNIIEQANVGALIVAQGILDLAKEFPRVVVTCVVGNHGRTQDKPYWKNKQQVNYDYVFYTNLALILKNQKNIKFNIPMSFWAGISVQGHNFHISHGDTIKSWGGIPFYGIKRERAGWVEISAYQKKFFRYFVRSHFHHYGNLQNTLGEDIMNGSLKGGDEYAIGFPAFSDPIQLLFGVHQKYGKSWQLAINTKYAPTNSRYRYNLTEHIVDQM